MRLRATSVPDWPPLAWLATVERDADAVHVLAGTGVEIADSWACEAVWDGPFAEGGFDRTDRVFGSGVRVRGDSVTFVSPASTVDRLHSSDDGRRVHVSNSLPCLLAAAGASLDPTCARYRAIGRSIEQGLDGYERDLPTSGAPTRITYFHNLVWDGAVLGERPKPTPTRDFTSYEAYRGFLDESMELLCASAAAPERARRFGLIGTLSSGYDSPAATVLAGRAGCREVIGFDRSRGGQDDSGAPIAETLGLGFHALATDAWRTEPLAAIPFLAAITSGGSSVSFAATAPLVGGCVLFTGYHGGMLWDIRATPGPPLSRKDVSGTDLTEFRLWTGFVHCPVPYLGALQADDLAVLSRSPDMAPWSVGGGYDKPLSRRLVEEAGVPREQFGTTKRATAQLILRGDDFLTPAMRADYFEWLGGRRPTSAPPDADTGTPTKHRYVFHWAVDRAKERYGARDGRP